MAKDNSNSEPLTIETSAFKKVMLQINIANRELFDIHCAHSWQEVSEQNGCLSVFVCEIDFFEEYVHNYGVQSTSFMLIVVGLALKSICEHNDCFLAHIENGRFMVVTKNIKQQKALQLAEYLREEVEHTLTEHKYSKVADIVTLSVGLSTSCPMSSHILLDSSKKQLINAKQLGGDQVSTDFSFLDKDTNTKHNGEPEPRVFAQATIDSVHSASESVDSQLGYDDLPLANAATNSVDQDTVLAGFEASIDDIEVQVSEVALASFMVEQSIYDAEVFQSDYKKQWQASVVEGEMLSMLICKVDFLQTYRDYYGEELTTELLKLVASALNLTCQKYNGGGYYTGEDKFIMLVKGFNATHSLRAAKYLHQLIAESEMEHLRSSVSDIVTLSIGLSSEFPEQESSIDTFLSNVEHTLSVAILEGRNQTSIS